jgi:hypothetical protein
MVAKRISVVLFAACLASCALPSHEQLVGVYAASYRGDQATLTLNADFTFRHVIQTSDGKRREGGASTYSERRENGTVRVFFENFRLVPAYFEQESKYSRRTEVTSWSTSVEKTWLGRYQLCFDSDVGYCYVRQ